MNKWSDIFFDMLLLYFCILGYQLIGEHVIDYKLSPAQAGLVMSAVFIIAYPIFGWKRTLPWRRLEQWSFAKWALFGAGIGIVTMLVDTFSRIIVKYFSI